MSPVPSCLTLGGRADPRTRIRNGSASGSVFLTPALRGRAARHSGAGALNGGQGVGYECVEQGGVVFDRNRLEEPAGAEHALEAHEVGRRKACARQKRVIPEELRG